MKRSKRDLERSILISIPGHLLSLVNKVALRVVGLGWVSEYFFAYSVCVCVWCIVTPMGWQRFTGSLTFARSLLQKIPTEIGSYPQKGLTIYIYRAQLPTNRTCTIYRFRNKYWTNRSLLQNTGLVDRALLHNRRIF